MIKLEIKTNGKDIGDSFVENEVTLEECALIIFRMEEIKQYLLSKDFETKFKVEGDLEDG